MKKKIIISIIALANVIFVPVFDVWGGLFPSDPDDGFFDAISYAFEGETDMWVVIFTFSILIPTLFMLITSLAKKEKLFKYASFFGIISMVIVFVLFVSDNEDISYLFDFDDGNIAIGTWIAFSLFIVAFVMSKQNKKDELTSVDNFAEETGSKGLTDAAFSVKNSQNNMEKFCPNCGAELQKGIMFCGNCGTKL